MQILTVWQPQTPQQHRQGAQGGWVARTIPRGGMDTMLAFNRRYILDYKRRAGL